MKILKFKAKAFTGFAFTGLLLGLAQTSAMGFSLDAFSSFSVDQEEIILRGKSTAPTTPNLKTFSATGLGTTTFGGSRTISITQLTSYQGSAASFFGNSIESTAELLGTTSFSTKAEIIWDGFDASNSGQNIEVDGSNVQDSFKININLLNLGTGDGDLSLNFEIQDTSNRIATITKTFVTADNIATLTPVYFPYSTRVEANPSNPVSLANIDRIRFYTSDENVGDDFVFDLIQTDKQVPFEFTPSLGLILGGGLFGFLRLQSKLKASKINKE